MLLILLFGKFFYIPKILYKLKQPNMKIKEKFDIIKFKCKNPVAGIVSHPDVKGKVFVAGSQG